MVMTRRILPIFAGLMVLASAGACASSTPGARADAPRVYRVPHGGEVRIPVAYVNRTDSTVYLGHCGETPPRYLLEKHTPGGWIPAYGPFCTDIAVPPLPVAPGDAFRTMITVRHETRENYFTPFMVDDVSGLYRMVWVVYGGTDRFGFGSGPLAGPLRRGPCFRLVLDGEKSSPATSADASAAGC